MEDNNLGIALLKKINERLPDSIKMVAAPLIRSGLIKNSAFIEQYRALKDAELLNEHELKEVAA